MVMQQLSLAANSFCIAEMLFYNVAVSSLPSEAVSSRVE